MLRGTRAGNGAQGGGAALEGWQRPWVLGGHSEEVTFGEGHLDEKRALPEHRAGVQRP